MKMTFSQMLSIYLKINETVTMDLEVDLLGRFIHVMNVENHKTIKSIKMMTDAVNENILRVFNNTGDSKEVLWEQKSLYIMETKSLMFDMIDKVSNENIQYSIDDQFEDSPYRVKVAFSHNDNTVLDQVSNYLLALSETSSITYKLIAGSKNEFEAIPSDNTKEFLYEADLNVDNVISDLSRMGFKSE